jgi:hypothetical protein
MTDKPHPDTLDLVLKKPLKVGDQTITAIHLEEPTAAQIEKANGAGANDITQAIVLISEVSGQPPPVIRLMGQRDLVEASTFLAGFFPAAPTGGWRLGS